MKRVCSLAIILASFAFNGVSLLAAGPMVAAGANHVVLLTDTGNVWAWGDNGWGQVGDGTTVGRKQPKEVTSLTGVTAVAAGGTSTYALKTDGTVWAWGENTHGQLGDGTFTWRATPVRVSNLSNVIAIAAGTAHAMALEGDGTLWVWGYGAYGQIGDGTTNTRSTPIQIVSLGTTVQSIAAAENHSHITKTDGTAWAWGTNGYYQAGDGTANSPRLAPVETGTLSSMTTVGAGTYAAFAWEVNGSLSGWGYNANGQVGDGTATDRTHPVAIAGVSSVAYLHGGIGHTIAATSTGFAWGWGLNNHGQIGDGTTSLRTSPVQLSGLDSIVSVSTGDYFSVAVSIDGRVWTWGSNPYGQLGDGTTDQRLSPVQLSDANYAWRVATPILSPNGGAFSANVNVTVTCATAGATLHYTTNGVDPTEAESLVTSGSTLTISQTTTLKVKAWLSGEPASNVATGTYTFTVATPVFSPGGGTYTAAQNVSISSTSGATIRYTTDGTTPTAGSTAYSGPIAVNTGTTLKAIAFKTGWTTSSVSGATYVFNYGTLAAPVFTPAPAQVGYGTQVSLSAAAFATIRYTTNGSTPTATSTIYTGPISVVGTTTILAKAFSTDWTTSAQAGGLYTVKVSTPTITPGAGTVAPGQLVTVSDVTPGAVLHYTTTGIDPTTSDPIIVSGGTLVAGNYTLKVTGFQGGWTTSDVASASYSLSGPFTNYAVNAANSFTVALKNDGTVWTWGTIHPARSARPATTDRLPLRSTA